MHRKKVYNAFQINLIVFYTICFMLVPTVSIIAYIFDFHLITSANTIILIGTVLMLVVFVFGLLYLMLTKDFYKRRLKPSYQREFTITLVTSGIGVLGLGVLFLYIGGQALYVPHVIIPLGIAVFSGMYLLGNRYFNVSLLRRNKR